MITRTPALLCVEVTEHRGLVAAPLHRGNRDGAVDGSLLLPVLPVRCRHED